MNHKFISLNFLLFFSLIIFGCKKNDLRSSVNASYAGSTAEIQPLKPHYEDTVSIPGGVAGSPGQNPDKQVSTFGIFSVSPPNTKIVIQYTGNQTYHFQVYNNLTQSNYTCNYHIYKDGVKVNGYYNPVRSQNDDKIDFDIKPVVGTYTLRIEYVSAPRGVPAFNLINYIIYPKPNVPAGKLPLLRYYNPQTGKHIFSNNWEELASGKDGFFFEKVQGWLNSGPGTNLAVFTRYYNPNNGDHYNSLSTGPVLGYTKEGPLGYLGTVSGQDMNLPLIQYNSQTTGHTYVSPPETLQADNVYEGVIGYMSVNTWAAYPDEGDIIRNDDTGEISLFIEGKLRHIPTSDILHTLFAYTDLLLKHYSAVQLANYQIPMGTPIALDNSLIRDTNNQYIYLREGNYIRHIESIEAMRRYHFSETIAGNVNGVANYTVGPDIKWLYIRDL